MMLSALVTYAPSLALAQGTFATVTVNVKAAIIQPKLSRTL